MRSRSHVLILRKPLPLLPIVPIEVQAQSQEFAWTLAPDSSLVMVVWNHGFLLHSFLFVWQFTVSIPFRFMGLVLNRGMRLWVVSVLKSRDEKLSMESVLLMSSKKSRVESSTSLKNQRFHGTVPRDVDTMSVSSERPLYDTSGALRNCGAQKIKRKRM